MQRVNLAMTKIWSSLSHKYDCIKFNNEKFVLKISAKDLAIFEDENSAKNDVSHYVYVVALITDDSGNYKEIGQTEMLEYNPHLNWNQTFIVTYSSNGNQKIKFRIWTYHKENNIKKLFGQATFDFSSLVEEHNNYLSKQVTTVKSLPNADERRVSADLNISYFGECRGSLIQNLPHDGELRVYGDHLVPENQVLTIEFSAHVLYSVNSIFEIDLNEPDLYFVVSKMSPNVTEVYRSEVICNSLNPKWKPFRIGLQQLCDGDSTRVIKLECFQRDDKFIGSVVTNVDQMLQFHPGKNIEYLFDVS